MKVVVTAATTGEWMPALLNIPSLYTSDSQRFKVQFHQSGVGMLASAVSLTSLIINDKPDFIIQIGIAGSFDPQLQPGTVVVVKNEMLGDMGVTEDNKWKDIFDLKLEKSSYPPFEKRKLPNPHLETCNLLSLPEVNAVTVNRITTGDQLIQQILKKYEPGIESMEGAALHYTCREFNIPFIQIRAISNYIGERDKSHWKLKEAIDLLNQSLLQYIDKLYKII